ncbi:GNAT family N-acetyltransferase [Mariniblastus fucicola]|nr:GNAT family protein [Mariniblastus fucicola]
MIRPFEDSDWPATWQILEPVLRAGETYPFPTDITEEMARHFWVESPLATFVALNEDREVIGTYYIKANHAGPGNHVSNCGYVVSDKARGKGVASAMCEHSQQKAIIRGFQAMQYNLVVATNEAAIRLWKKHGFAIVGTLPDAFYHPRFNYVDAHIMYKKLKLQP